MKKKSRRLVDEALKPLKEIKEYGSWHDDGMRIVNLLRSKEPGDQAAIAQLYHDCPHKHSVCTKTGQQIKITEHTVAAWAANPDNHTGIVPRLKAAKLI